VIREQSMREIAAAAPGSGPACQKGHTTMLDGNTAALRQQEDLWDEQFDSDVSALAAEIFYTNVQLHGVPVDDRNAQVAALRQAHGQHAELLAFAVQWDAQVAADWICPRFSPATCSSEEAINIVLRPATCAWIREQIRQEFD
jgi:hypothetical protein